MLNKDTDKDVMQQEQQENKKLYPKSFRITDEVYKAFKDISKNFINQDETLKQLCQCYEINSNVSVLPTNIQDDVQKFNNYVDAIQRLYISSLEYTNIVKDSVQEKYRAEFELKDNKIFEYQKTIDSLNKDREDLDGKLKNLDAEFNQSKEDFKQLQDELNKTISDFQDRINDKEQIISSLKETIKELENEVAGLKDKADAYDKLKSENEIMKRQLDENKQETEKLNINNKKKLLEVREEYNKKIEEMNSKHIKEIESYSKRYEELLKEMEKITASKTSKTSKTTKTTSKTAASKTSKAKE